MTSTEIKALIHYEEGTAHFTQDRRGTPGTLEMCIIWRSAAKEIRKRTGSSPEEFLDGMRELLAPIGG